MRNILPAYQGGCQSSWSQPWPSSPSWWRRHLRRRWQYSCSKG